MGARLLPTAMHPWMNPALETVLWPLDNREVYESFDRIFSCRGHGWSNLQSMHLNLPFVGDDEFARLHSAIRLVLPMIPGLSASSPFEEGRATGWLDNRMKHYFNNSASIPEVAGEIVPEPVRSEEEYRERIFEPMFRAIAPYDTDGVLQEEWLNARGAIARFERGSIEIRVIDTQESVTADLAIAELVVWAVRSLVEERWSTTAEQLCCSQATLVELLRDAVRVGPEARVQDAALLECLGLPITISRLGDIWSALLKAARSSGGISERSASPLDVLLVEGALASRILRGAETTAAGLRGTYRHLADCLQRDEMYRAY
jgi:gamma-glutamyl:cysteine ligase YbdK (ATP-grasp superfamily)